MNNDNFDELDDVRAGIYYPSSPVAVDSANVTLTAEEEKMTEIPFQPFNSLLTTLQPYEQPEEKLTEAEEARRAVVIQIEEEKREAERFGTVVLNEQDQFNANVSNNRRRYTHRPFLPLIPIPESDMNLTRAQASHMLFSNNLDVQYRGRVALDRIINPHRGRIAEIITQLNEINIDLYNIYIILNVIPMNSPSRIGLSEATINYDALIDIEEDQKNPDLPQDTVNEMLDLQQQAEDLYEDAIVIDPDQPMPQIDAENSSDQRLDHWIGSVNATLEIGHVDGKTVLPSHSVADNDQILRVISSLNANPDVAIHLTIFYVTSQGALQQASIPVTLDTLNKITQELRGQEGNLAENYASFVQELKNAYKLGITLYPAALSGLRVRGAGSFFTHWNLTTLDLTILQIHQNPEISTITELTVCPPQIKDTVLNIKIVQGLMQGTQFEFIDFTRLTYIKDNFNKITKHRSWDTNARKIESYKIFKIIKCLTNNTLQVTYAKSTRKGSDELGRVYGENGTTAGQLPREVRAKLLGGYYVDIDMVNAHPVILDNLVSGYYPALHKYVTHRDECLKEVMDKLKFSKKCAKELFIQPIYGANIKNMIMRATKATLQKQQGGKLTDYEQEAQARVDNMPDCLTQYIREVKEITGVLVTTKNHFGIKVGQGARSVRATKASLLIQEVENKCLSVIYTTITREIEGLTNKCILQFDGIMVPSVKGINKRLLLTCEKQIKTVLGLDIKLDFKSIVSDLPIDEEKFTRFLNAPMKIKVKKDKQKPIDSSNCFMYAIKASEKYTEEEVRLTADYVTKGSVPKSALNPISIKLNTRFIIKEIDNKGNIKAKRIGSAKCKKKLALCLIEKHWFLETDIAVSKYAIEHYTEVKGLPNWTQIRTIDTSGKNTHIKYYKKRDKNNKKKAHTIKSSVLIKAMLKNPDTLEALSNRDAMKYFPQRYKELDIQPVAEVNTQEVEEPRPTIRVVDPVVKGSENSHIHELIYFADLEADPTGNRHVAYSSSIRCATDGSEVINFIGKECIESMLKHCKNKHIETRKRVLAEHKARKKNKNKNKKKPPMPEMKVQDGHEDEDSDDEYENEPQPDEDINSVEEEEEEDDVKQPRVKTTIYFHNAKYDMTLIMRFIKLETKIENAGKIMLVRGEYDKVKMIFKDTYAMIPMALSKFASTFGLDVKKEVYPYELYTQKNRNKRMVPLTEALEHFDEEDHEKFLALAADVGCIEGEMFNHWKYCTFYNNQDVEVLMAGYIKFGKMMYQVTKINILDAISLPKVAHSYMIMSGCYKKSLMLEDVAREYISKSIVGGRCAMANNKQSEHKCKPNEVGEMMNDLDACSLYPSAIVELAEKHGGYLNGTPKLLPDNSTYADLQKYDGYFVTIEVFDTPIHRPFPILSYINEDGKGGRVWSNTATGKRVVDRFTLEDFIEFQGAVPEVSFKIINGYYFDEGRNQRVGKVMKRLYANRKKHKQEGNPIQFTEKLLMNSAYGKTLQKPILKEPKFALGIDNTRKYIANHQGTTGFFTKLDGCDQYEIETYKAIADQASMPHIGSEILSMSKRIMNRVMCLAHDKNLNITYQDTDSMHIKNKDVDTLAIAFKERYGKVLIGSDMGQFHCDFETYKGMKPRGAVRSIIVGKKVYMDKIQYVTKEGKCIYRSHIRMKGIPTFLVEEYARANRKIGNTSRLYQSFKRGEAHTFDLAKGVSFNFTKDGRVVTRNKFERRIQFTPTSEVIDVEEDLAHEYEGKGQPSDPEIVDMEQLLSDEYEEEPMLSSVQYTKEELAALEEIPDEDFPECQIICPDVIPMIDVFAPVIPMIDIFAKQPDVIPVIDVLGQQQQSIPVIDVLNTVEKEVQIPTIDVTVINQQPKEEEQHDMDFNMDDMLMDELVGEFDMFEEDINMNELCKFCDGETQPNYAGVLMCEDCGQCQDGKSAEVQYDHTGVLNEDGQIPVPPSPPVQVEPVSEPEPEPEPESEVEEDEFFAAIRRNMRNANKRKDEPKTLFDKYYDAAKEHDISREDAQKQFDQISERNMMPEGIKKFMFPGKTLFTLYMNQIGNPYHTCHDCGSYPINYSLTHKVYKCTQCHAPQGGLLGGGNEPSVEQTENIVRVWIPALITITGTSTWMMCLYVDGKIQQWKRINKDKNTVPTVVHQVAEYQSCSACNTRVRNMETHKMRCPESTYHCDLCDSTIKYKSKYAHLKSKGHKLRLDLDENGDIKECSDVKTDTPTPQYDLELVSKYYDVAKDHGVSYDEALDHMDKIVIPTDIETYLYPGKSLFTSYMNGIGNPHHSCKSCGDSSIHYSLSHKVYKCAGCGELQGGLAGGSSDHSLSLTPIAEESTKMVRINTPLSEGYKTPSPRKDNRAKECSSDPTHSVRASDPFPSLIPCVSESDLSVSEVELIPDPIFVAPLETRFDRKMYWKRHLQGSPLCNKYTVSQKVLRLEAIHRNEDRFSALVREMDRFIDLDNLTRAEKIRLNRIMGVTERRKPKPKPVQKVVSHPSPLSFAGGSMETKPVSLTTYETDSMDDIERELEEFESEHSDEEIARLAKQYDEEEQMTDDVAPSPSPRTTEKPSLLKLGAYLQTRMCKPEYWYISRIYQAIYNKNGGQLKSAISKGFKALVHLLCHDEVIRSEEHQATRSMFEKLLEKRCDGIYDELSLFTALNYGVMDKEIQLLNRAVFGTKHSREDVANIRQIYHTLVNNGLYKKYKNLCDQLNYISL